MIRSALAPLFLLITCLGACVVEEGARCRSSAECDDQSLCRMGACTPQARPGDANGPNDPSAPGQDPTMPPHHDGALDAAPHAGVGQPPGQAPQAPSPEEDAAPAAPDEGDAEVAQAAPEVVADDSPCATRVRPRAGDLVINEALMAVPAGLDGDANGDGVRDAYADEFVELVNRSDDALELEGVQVLSKESVKLTFAQRCLASGHAIVVFGGPRDVIHAPIAGTEVVTAPSRLSFSNSGGSITLRDALGRELFIFSYGQVKAHAYVLWPELTGDALVPHPEVSAGALFSPGTCVDGAPLASGCVAPEPEAFEPE